MWKSFTDRPFPPYFGISPHTPSQALLKSAEMDNWPKRTLIIVPFRLGKPEHFRADFTTPAVVFGMGTACFAFIMKTFLLFFA
jgi:hypothetical protein